MDVNSVTLTGHLTKDAMFKILPTGTQLLEFVIANNTGFGDYAQCTFFNCKLWGKQAQNLQQYMTKGKLVGVTGEVKLEKYFSQAQDAEVQKLVVDNVRVTLLGGGTRTDSETKDPVPLDNDAVPYDESEEINF